MIPQIIDVTETNFKYYYVTSDGFVVCSFKAELIDLDSSEASDRLRSLGHLFQQMPEGLITKYQLNASASTDSFAAHQRSEALSEVGFVKQELFIHFETEISTISKASWKAIKSFAQRNLDPHLYAEQIQKMSELIPLSLFESSGLVLKPCTLEEIQSFYPSDKSPITYGINSLICNDEHIGVIKLYKLSNSELSFATLPSIRSDFSLPYSLVSRVRAPNAAILKERLNRKRMQEEKLKGSKASEKAQATDEAIADTDNRGDRFLFLEMQLIVKRSTSVELLKDLGQISQKLFSYGEFIVETTIGCEQALRAALPGGKSHFPERLFEKHNKLAALVPVAAFGNSLKMPSTPTALAYHRMDLSIDFHDPSDLGLANGMRNIFAKAGHGKSVFLNLSLLALAENRNANLYVVDVASSHTRTIQELEGRTYNIDMNTKSPINPFRILKDSKDPSILSILKNNISELLLDERERFLGTADSYYLDEAILAYAETDPKLPSIPDFIQFIFPKFDADQTLFPKFPRKEHLLRYSKKGIYRNIFGTFVDEELPKIQYFNIQQVSTAANSAVMKAIVSSALADFWIKVETKPKGDPIEFVVDEAAMVIESNFKSLTHQTTQTRKENGRLTLVAQKIEQLVVDGNTTLLSNAATNIFLGNDDKLETFREALSLNFGDIEKIRSLQIRPGEYSQFYIKNALSAHVGQILLAKREYWRATTRPTEREFIEKMQNAFPNIPINIISKYIAENELRSQL